MSDRAFLNKAELSEVLSTSLPTLDKMLRKYAEFPVVARGRNGVEWQFDPAAVVAFLDGLDRERIAAGRAKDDLMQQYTLPGVEEPGQPGLSPRDMLNMAKLRQLEREEQKESGFLVPTALVRQVVTGALVKLRNWQEMVVRQVLRDANVPDAVVRSVQSRIEEGQRLFVDGIKAELMMDEPDDEQLRLV